MIPNILQFNLIDSQNNPLTGSLVIIRPLFSSGSWSTVPQQTFADDNGTASFYNVLPTIFEYSYTAAGANSASLVNSNYVAYEPTVGYISIPDVTGSINGFNYIINNFSSGSFNSGSVEYGSESQLETDIPTMTNIIRNYINDWALQNNGVCFIAEDDQEKINIGFNNCVGPRCLVIFLGEEPDGDLSELTGRVRRNFDIIIQRGKIFNEPRNSALTSENGPARKFYGLVSELRDTIRSIYFPPSVYSPCIYNGIRPSPQDGQWFMDSYAINISVLCEIGRIETLPSQLSGGEWIALDNPMLSQLPNGFPSPF